MVKFVCKRVVYQTRYAANAPIFGYAEDHLLLINIPGTNKAASSPSSSSPSSPTLNRSNSKQPHSSNVGVIVGAVVGSVIGLALVLALLYFLWRRSRRQDSHEQAEKEPTSTEANSPVQPQELHGKDWVHEVPGEQRHAELAGSRPQQHELDSRT